MRVYVSTTPGRPYAWTHFIDLLYDTMGAAELEYKLPNPAIFHWRGIQLNAASRDFDLWTITGPDQQLWFMANMPPGGRIL